ncbi:MAG: mycothiol system anti-sigma-R factor [Gemmatimonadaceae bacterium]|jgi:anti-sigma factor (TIGR02949 family)|nr:mycothiol system anti-sigma-R factor [Gemmatimonadaceae bacterium]
MDCLDVVRQLWDYLDGELTDDRMEAIRAHLAACRNCYPHYDFERAFLDAVAATRREQPAPNMVRRKVMAKLRQAGFAGM